MFGLYRRAYGGEIVKSFYDFDTQTIGPFSIPIDLYYDVELSQGNMVNEGCLYKTLLEREDILAIFNLNNFCLVCVTPKFIYEVNKDGTFNGDLIEWPLLMPVEVPELEHIGYIKTYQENLSVSTIPYYLFRNKKNKIDCTDEVVTGSPLVNPPLQLYKSLIDTAENVHGVYFDIKTTKAIYVDKNGKEVSIHG